MLLLILSFIAALATASRSAEPHWSAAVDSHGNGILARTTDTAGEHVELLRFEEPASPKKLASLPVRIAFAGADPADTVLSLVLKVDDLNRNFLVWQTRGTNTLEGQSTIWAHSVDEAGEGLWGRRVVTQNALTVAPTMTPDGEGGVYIAYGIGEEHSLANDAVEVRRIDARGSLVWARHLAATRAQFRVPKIVPDGEGGLILVFEARILEDGVEGVRHILAQRYTSAGEPMWTERGDFVAVAATVFDEHDPVLIPHDRGVIAVFESSPSGGSRVGDVNIAAQRLDGNGIQLWGDAGVPAWVSATTASETNPAAVCDGSGGIVVAFEGRLSGRNDSDIWMQRISSTGVASWSADGMPCAFASGDDDEFMPYLSVTGCDTVVVGYAVRDAGADLRAGGTGAVHVNAVSVLGRYLWREATVLPGDANSVLLIWSSDDDEAYALVNAPDDPGGATPSRYAVCLTDGAVRTDQFATAVRGDAPMPAELVRPASPNPFNATTTLRFWSSAGEDLDITVANPLGQAVRHMTYHTPVSGWHSVQWDGESDSGAAVGSGTYLFRIIGSNTSRGRVLSGRVTLAR